MQQLLERKEADAATLCYLMMTSMIRGDAYFSAATMDGECRVGPSSTARIGTRHSPTQAHDRGTRHSHTQAHTQAYTQAHTYAQAQAHTQAQAQAHT